MFQLLTRMTAILAVTLGGAAIMGLPALVGFACGVSLVRRGLDSSQGPGP